MRHKVANCHDYFNTIKRQREANARLIIKYYVMKYFIKLKNIKLLAIAKKKAAAAKKLEDEKKRKSKYGYSPKTKKPVKKGSTTKQIINIKPTTETGAISPE